MSWVPVRGQPFTVDREEDEVRFAPPSVFDRLVNRLLNRRERGQFPFWRDRRGRRRRMMRARQRRQIDETLTGAHRDERDQARDPVPAVDTAPGRRETAVGARMETPPAPPTTRRA